ncbi:hypothetical protein CEXT_290001 [Caerostris extrusa]|uniref:Uncharacterized protein n=1 Tax=Caerostris extrusa TaxID=172846 RepID=A0AAV4MME5_CAEEX|nr:hypothetical protein CEXT_290001 [Caerostris extrusa]
MEEISQRGKIMKAKIDLEKGREILEQGAVILYIMSLSSGTGLEEAFGGNIVFDNAFAKFVRHIENVEYLLLFCPRQEDRRLLQTRK